MLGVDSESPDGEVQLIISCHHSLKERTRAVLGCGVY